MLKPEDIFNLLTKNGVNFYTGVPDSLLKSFCAYLSDHTKKEQHIIAANEGAAIALGIGHYLSTKTLPLIYMQNSGLGNAINPLLSLAAVDVYAIPLLLMIGWRGEPGISDEPQHKTQGRVMLSMLDAMEIPYSIIEPNIEEATTLIEEITHNALSSNQVHALIVRKNTFEPYELQHVSLKTTSTLSREIAIKTLVHHLSPKDIIISTTGMASRELFEIRTTLQQAHQSDFLTIGGMGHASQIALGIALNNPHRNVICLDGDGATIMHMGSLAIAAQNAGNNFTHIVINNGAHHSVGGQATVGFDIDLCQTATSFGYKAIHRVTSADEFAAVLNKTQNQQRFIEVIVNKAVRKNLGRPTSAPKEYKAALMRQLIE